MKESHAEKELRRRLGPSKFSGEGFLGNDTRPVREIISTDAAELDRLGVTGDYIADALADVYSRAVKAMGSEIEISPGITAVYHESMGKIPSPFTGEGVFEKGEVIVYDKINGETSVLTKLSIHLIKFHGFYQGRGSRYRISPRSALNIAGRKKTESGNAC